MNNCPQCQQILDQSARFCENCGASLDRFNAPTLNANDADVASTLPMGDSLIGRTLSDRYKVVAFLGQGGIGTVYRADRLHIGGEVAIKVLKPELVADASILERFRREARAAGTLRHQNIVKIHDFIEASDSSPAFIVMELVEGDSLRVLLERLGRFEPLRAVALMREICAGVSAAHREGIFHRDLKPENIIVLLPESESKTESVKVLDFGIAKLQNLPPLSDLTQPGALIGTPQYMSPEQCRGEAVDARSDVYSLGVILCEMLTGTPPFAATSRAEIISKHLRDKAPALPLHLEITPALERVIQRALAKEAKERQADASAFSSELREAGERPHVPSVTPSPTQTIIDLGQGLTTVDSLVFKLACEEAIEKGHRYLIGVEQIIEKAKVMSIPQSEVIESLQMLSEQFFIKPHTVMGGELPFPWFDVSTYGFEEYAKGYVDEYEKVTDSVIFQIVDLGKKDSRLIIESLNQPRMIVDHILNKLIERGLIMATEYNEGLIYISEVSTQLKRMMRNK